MVHQTIMTETDMDPAGPAITMTIGMVQIMVDLNLEAIFIVTMTKKMMIELKCYHMKLWRNIL
jgi:hypothetical protein